TGLRSGCGGRSIDAQHQVARLNPDMGGGGALGDIEDDAVELIACTDAHSGPRRVRQALADRKRLSAGYWNEKKSDRRPEKLLRAYGAAVLTTIARLNAIGKQIKQAIRCPRRVNRVTMKACRRLPVFLRKRSSSRLVEMSQKCQKATSVDLDQILVRQRSAGELSELAADSERSLIDADEANPVDERRHFSLCCGIVAGIE